MLHNELDNIFYKPVHAELFTYPDIKQIDNDQEQNMYTMLIIREGASSVLIHDKVYFASKGKVFIYPSTFKKTFIQVATTNFSFFEITFLAISIQNEQSFELVNQQTEYIVYPYKQLIQYSDKLYTLFSCENTNHSLLKQSIFYQILHFTMTVTMENTEHIKMIQAVEKTIHYIKKHYKEELSVQKLASLAKLPIWQYREIFYTLTGEKTLEYINNKRMQYAKELILTSNQPLKTIANCAGFQDEYYFNRRFKAYFGSPPKRFAVHTKKTHTIIDEAGHIVEIPNNPERIIFHGETLGDLFIFNKTPIGGLKNYTEQTIYKQKLKSFIDTAFPLNLAKLKRANPDLIIFSNSENQKYKQMTKLAPTVFLNSWATLDERISRLGKWFNKEAETNHWLSHFKEKEERVWRNLPIHKQETASIFLFNEQNKLFTLTNIGIAQALFHQNGFKQVPVLSEALQRGYGYVEVPIHRINEYAGEKIFFLTPSIQSLKTAFKSLIATNYWKDLQAVKNKQVYYLFEPKWNRSDAYTRERLLDELPSLFN